MDDCTVVDGVIGVALAVEVGDTVAVIAEGVPVASMLVEVSARVLDSVSEGPWLEDEAKLTTWLVTIVVSVLVKLVPDPVEVIREVMVVV